MANSIKNSDFNSHASQERMGFFVFMGAVVLSAFAFYFHESSPLVFGVMALFSFCVSLVCRWRLWCLRMVRIW